MSGLIGLAEAAKLLGATGRGGVGVHPATLTRWSHRGVNTPAGRVKLRTVRIGAKLATTAAWVGEFVDSTTTATRPVDTTPVRSPAERDRASAAAAAELDAIGA